MVGVAEVYNWNTKLCLFQPVFQLYDQEIVNLAESRPNVLDGFLLNMERVVLLLVLWFIWEDSLVISDDVAFLPLFQILGLFVDLPVNVAAEYYVQVNMLIFFPLGLFVSVLKFNFVNQNFNKN